MSWHLSRGRPREAVRHFVSTWPTRLAELVGRRGWGPWDGGYGTGGPDTLGYLFEAFVRCAELLGFGLLLTLADDFMHGPRTKSAAVRFGADGRAFAKTYFAPRVLAKALLDVESDVAHRMRIAFVFGRIVKAAGVPDEPLLAHELVHVEQYYRWGWAYVAKAVHAQAAGAGYRYPAAFRATRCERVLAEARPEFAGSLRCVRQVTGYDPRLNAEQEAARLEDHARERLGLAPRWVA